jgi:hypothetical protein
MITTQPGSLEALHQHTRELANRRVENDPAVRKLLTAKQAAWLFLLACSFLLYYLIDKMQEALAILI